MAMLGRWVGPSWEQCLEHSISTVMSVLLCPAEARGMPMTWQNQAGCHPSPSIGPTPTDPFPGWEVLHSFIRSPHWLVTMRLSDGLDKQIPAKFPGLYLSIPPVPVCHRYQGYVFWFPFLFSEAGWRRTKNNEYVKSLGSIRALHPLAMWPCP